MSTWTLLKTPAATQHKYISQVAEYHPAIPYYVPHFTRLSRPAKLRRPIPITRPLYPGYIFVQPNLDRGEHYLLTRLPTKAWFVRFGKDLSIIPDSVIEELRRLESLHLLTPLEDQNRIMFTPGSKIRVAFPTIDVIATLIRIIADTRAVVETPLGRATVPLPACHLA